MRLVLGIATVLGVVGPVAAFGLLYLGDRVFGLGHPRLQTLMYLMLSVAGHLTIFLTRTRGPFWSIRPARVLWIAVLGTQIVATLIAVYGLFMTPLGWGWAAFVWGYALVWFLVNDRVKLLAYRVFDPTATPLLAKKPADMTPQIAKRAYELYEQGGRQDGHADQDWVKAEQEVRKDEAKAEPQPETKAEPQPETKAEPQPKAKTEPQPEAKNETKPEAKAETPAGLTPQIAKRAYELYEQGGRQDGHKNQDWVKAEQEVRKDEAKTEPQPESKAETPAGLTQQIAKRAHELYEERVSQDSGEVQDWEKAEREIRKDEPRK